MKYKKIYWHDGNIKTISYHFPLSRREKSSIEMIMEIYKDHIASNPFDHKVVFPNVTELFTSIDFNEIVDNVGAGSIQWVYQKKIQIEGKKSYLYTINLCGGRFSIYSDKIKINRIR